RQPRWRRHQFPGQADLEILKTLKTQGAAKAHDGGLADPGGRRHFIDRGIDGHLRLPQDQARHFLQGRFQGRINPSQADQGAALKVPAPILRIGPLHGQISFGNLDNNIYFAIKIKYFISIHLFRGNLPRAPQFSSGGPPYSSKRRTSLRASSRVRTIPSHWASSTAVNRCRKRGPGSRRNSRIRSSPLSSRGRDSWGSSFSLRKHRASSASSANTASESAGFMGP